jgi:hypothetical protein
MGIATPTEGGAMGATGALIMALARKRLTLSLLKQAMDTTAKLTTFVVFILVGARVFSLTFYGVDGHRWVEHLLTGLPGGEVGFLIVVNVLIFLLAFFLDFFELSFIVVPLLGPVAEALGIDLIWFGILLAVNMQTSFMHPPFGFALFYLRSVAPASVKTTDIYWGAIPFVCIQIVMVGILICVPATGDFRPRQGGQGGSRFGARSRSRVPIVRRWRRIRLRCASGRRARRAAAKAGCCGYRRHSRHAQGKQGKVRLQASRRREVRRATATGMQGMLTRKGNGGHWPPFPFLRRENRQAALCGRSLQSDLALAVHEVRVSALGDAEPEVLVVHELLVVVVDFLKPGFFADVSA